MTRKFVRPKWDEPANPMPAGWNQPIDMSAANQAAAALAAEEGAKNWPPVSASDPYGRGEKVTNPPNVDERGQPRLVTASPGPVQDEPIATSQAVPNHLPPQDEQQVAPAPAGQDEQFTGSLRDFYVGTDTPNYVHSTDRPATRWEQFAAQLFSTDRAINNYGQRLTEASLARQAQIAGEEKITAEEANKRWPGLEVPFEQPQYASVAKAIAERQAHLRERESIIASGPQDTVSALTGLAAGFANWSTDPINALMVVAGGAAATRAGVGALTGLPKLGAVFAENLAVAAPGAAINYYQAQQDQRKVDAGDFIQGELTGAAFGTGIHYLGSFLKNAVKEAKSKAVVDVIDGKPVDVGPIADNAKQKAAGIPKESGPSAAEYQFKPLQSTTDRPWFSSSDSSPGGFKESQATIIGPDLGDGRYITDNPYAANTHEVVHEVAAKELKLLDIEQAPSPEISAVIEPHLPEGHGATTIKEMLAAVRSEMQHGAVSPAALNEINVKLAEMGYDGLSHVQVDSSGKNPHNVALVFDPQGTGDASGKLTETGKMGANPEMNQGKSPEELKQLAEERASPENSVDHDPTANERLAKNIAEPQVSLDSAKIQEIEAETADLKKNYAEQGLLTPEDIAMIDAEHERIDGGAKEEAVKAFKFCEGKSL